MKPCNRCIFGFAHTKKAGCTVLVSKVTGFASGEFLSPSFFRWQEQHTVTRMIGGKWGELDDGTQYRVNPVT